MMVREELDAIRAKVNDRRLRWETDVGEWHNHVEDLLEEVDSLRAELDQRPTASPEMRAFMEAWWEVVKRTEPYRSRMQTPELIWLLVHESEDGDGDVLSVHRTPEGAVDAARWRWSELPEVARPEEVQWTLDDGGLVEIHFYRVDP